MSRIKSNSKNVSIFDRKSNTFHYKNRDISLSIDRIFHFVQKHRITVFKTLDDYNFNIKETRRVFWVTFLRSLSLITCLRYMFSALIPEKWVIIWMSDANYLLGNRQLVSLIISIGALIAFNIEAITQYKEMTQSCELWQFLYDVKHKRLTPLNDRHSKRLTLVLKLMAKYLMEQTFWLLFILSSLMFTAASLITFLDQKYDFNGANVIIWLIILLVFLDQFYAMICKGFVVAVLSTIYLKYRFEEINEEIKSCIKFNNNYRLKRAVARHNYICVKTSQLNNYWSHVVFQLYYIASPALMVLLYLIQ